MKSYLRLFLLAVSSLMLSCVSPYDAQALKDLTDLKAFHVKLVEENLSASKPSLTSPKLEERADEGDLLFRKAIVYSQTHGDSDRTANLLALKAQFEEDIKDIRLIKSGKRRSGSAYSEALKEDVSEDYDLAIKGEKARPDAPSN